MATKAKQKRKPSLRAKKAIDILVENRGKSVSAAMREAGYSEITAKNPKNLTESKTWQDLMQDYLSDEAIAEKHKELLNSSRLDHMVFSLGPRDEEERAEYIKIDIAKAEEKGYEYVEIEYITDDDIREMLADVNCKVRRIVHRETARDVYFWSADNKARKDAIDMAYKLKGSYAAEKKVNLNIEVEALPEIQDVTKKLNELYRGAGVSSNGGASSAVGAEVQDKE